jgi:hypothetical protein
MGLPHPITLQPFQASYLPTYLLTYLTRRQLDIDLVGRNLCASLLVEAVSFDSGLSLPSLSPLHSSLLPSSPVVCGRRRGLGFEPHGGGGQRGQWRP